LFIAGLILSQSNIADRLSVSYTNFTNYINYQDHRSSTGQRLDMWHAAWCFHQESPLIGNGPHQFKKLILDPKRTCEISVTNSKQYYVQAHSFYFNALATVGWLGLISMLLFFGMTVQYAWTLPLIAKVTIPAVIITFLSYSITVDLLFQRYMADKHLTLLAILLGLSLNYKKKEQGEFEVPPGS
jgi:O-antigen ligase